MPLGERELRACCREAVAATVQACRDGRTARPWGMTYVARPFLLGEFAAALALELEAEELSLDAAEEVLSRLPYVTYHGSGWYSYQRAA